MKNAPAERAQYALNIATRIGYGTGEKAHITIQRARSLRILLDGWVEELYNEQKAREDAMQQAVISKIVKDARSSRK